MNRVYEGVRAESPDEHSIRITVDGRPLNLRNDLRNHSPNGGNWGYAGSRPACLTNVTGNDEVAEPLDPDDQVVGGLTFTWDDGPTPGTA